MQVNHALKVKFPSQRDEVLRALSEAFGVTEITFCPQDGPDGAAFPIWASVIFSAEHGDWERLVAEVWGRLRDANLDGYLEECPWSGSPPPCVVEATASR